jgi:hypothetical protein
MKTITSDLFNAFSKWPLKCYRVSKGEKGFGNVFTDWILEQKKSYPFQPNSQSTNFRSNSS